MMLSLEEKGDVNYSLVYIGMEQPTDIRIHYFSFFKMYEGYWFHHDGLLLKPLVDARVTFAVYFSFPLVMIVAMGKNNSVK